MTQKIATVPIPSRENLQEIPQDQLNSNFSRVVFDKTGQSYQSAFEQTLPPTPAPPPPALFGEERSSQSIEYLNYINFPVELYNEGVTSLVSPGGLTGFVIKPGYLYELSAILTAKSFKQDFLRVEFQWLNQQNSSYIGSTGSIVYNAFEGQTYAELASVPAIAQIKNESSEDILASLIVTNTQGLQISSGGFSSAKISILEVL